MFGLGAPELMILMPFVLAVGGAIWLSRRSSARAEVAASLPGVSGWLPDPSGHEYRYWDGIGWTEHVSDGGVVAAVEVDDSTRQALPAPAVPGAGVPKRAGPIRWYEPLVYIVILAAWLAVTLGTNIAVADSSLDGKVAYTQQEADRINAEASGQGRGAALVVALLAIAVIGSKVGYRGRDAFMLLIPIWGVLIVLKLLWRLACLKRSYWAAAPT
jgi:hypothetical protein